MYRDGTLRVERLRQGGLWKSVGTWGWENVYRTGTCVQKVM